MTVTYPLDAVDIEVCKRAVNGNNQRKMREALNSLAQKYSIRRSTAVVLWVDDKLSVTGESLKGISPMQRALDNEDLTVLNRELAIPRPGSKHLTNTKWWLAGKYGLNFDTIFIHHPDTNDGNAPVTMGSVTGHPVERKGGGSGGSSSGVISAGGGGPMAPMARYDLDDKFKGCNLSGDALTIELANHYNLQPGSISVDSVSRKVSGHPGDNMHWYPASDSVLADLWMNSMIPGKTHTVIDRLCELNKAQPGGARMGMWNGKKYLRAKPKNTVVELTPEQCATVINKMFQTQLPLNAVRETLLIPSEKQFSVTFSTPGKVKVEICG